MTSSSLRLSARLCALAATLVCTTASLAKLPAPSPEAKAKAAETTARTAWANKVDAYQLCQAQDRVAARYREQAQAAGKQLAPAPQMPACTDPGPFAYSPPTEEVKPIEAAGAHSPTETAKSPPNTNAQSSEVNPAPKK